MAKKTKKNGSRKSGSSSGMKTVGAAVAGGAVGAIGGALAARAGVDPQTAAIGVTLAGGVGAFALTGATRWAAAGAAAAGAGQLALGWLAKKTLEQQTAQAAQVAGTTRQSSLPGDVRSAFNEAREQMADDYGYAAN